MDKCPCEQCICLAMCKCKRVIKCYLLTKYVNSDSLMSIGDDKLWNHIYKFLPKTSMILSEQNKTLVGDLFK